MVNLIHTMTQFEVDLLRYYSEPDQGNRPIGAAFNAASEALKGMGYLDGLPYRINDKGRAMIEQIDNPPKPVINQITRDDVRKFNENVGYMDSVDEHGNAFNYYQEIATKSAIYPGKGTPFGLMYAALGLAEAGEVQNKVKKAFRDDGVIEIVDNVYNDEMTLHKVVARSLPPERRAQIIKELGGALWYMSAVCNEIGATLSEVALTNLEELCGRTERDTLRGDGDDR